MNKQSKTVHGDLTREAGAQKPYEQVAAEKRHAYEMYEAVCAALGFPQHWMQDVSVVVDRARGQRYGQRALWLIGFAGFMFGLAAGWGIPHVSR